MTDKSNPYTLDRNALERISRELGEATRNHPEVSVIVGTGAGSFAHTSAKKYGIRQGFTSLEGAYGACVVHYDAVHLHLLVLEEMLKNNVPAFGISPSSCCVSENGKVVGVHFEALKNILEKRQVPFLFGDVLTDRGQGSTILSTDALIPLIVDWLKKEDIGTIQGVYHLGSYEGIFDKRGNVLPLMTEEIYENNQDIFHDVSYADVTGGMEGKVKEMLQMSKDMCVSSYILDGRKEGIFEEIISGHIISGTKIT